MSTVPADVGDVKAGKRPAKRPGKSAAKKVVVVDAPYVAESVGAASKAPSVPESVKKARWMDSVATRTAGGPIVGAALPTGVPGGTGVHASSPGLLKQAAAFGLIGPVLGALEELTTVTPREISDREARALAPGNYLWDM